MAMHHKILTFHLLSHSKRIVDKVLARLQLLKQRDTQRSDRYSHSAPVFIQGAGPIADGKRLFPDDDAVANLQRSETWAITKEHTR